MKTLLSLSLSYKTKWFKNLSSLKTRRLSISTLKSLKHSILWNLQLHSRAHLPSQKPFSESTYRALLVTEMLEAWLPKSSTKTHTANLPSEVISTWAESCLQSTKAEHRDLCCTHSSGLTHLLPASLHVHIYTALQRKNTYLEPVIHMREQVDKRSSSLRVNTLWLSG